MNALSRLLKPSALLLTVATVIGCGETDSASTRYSIAGPEYQQLTEEYLQHLAKFEWEDSYAFLSDDVEFKLPDGDQGTRTVYKGLDQVKAFWEDYVQSSGNDRASFKDFVHIPVQANQYLDHVEETGVFNLCYFSAELGFGSRKADVRMHWAFHFNSEKKIDGIYTYYDRTPIIDAAGKNFLIGHTNRVHNNKNGESHMVIQTVKLTSTLNEEELLKAARARVSEYAALPGLLQKYYTRLSEPNTYVGILIWDSQESFEAYKASELATSVSQTYQVTEKPEVALSEVLFQLRD